MVQDPWHVGEQLGVRAGETLCHITYLDMSCSLVCMPISHTRAGTQTHAAATATPPARLLYLPRRPDRVFYKDDLNNGVLEVV